MLGIVFMILPFRTLLMAVFVVAALHAPVKADAPTPLTKQQVERFIKSFDAMLDMASQYWGDRKYTPHGIIMPFRGTVERALVEMEAGGLRQEFENLFLDMGFRGYAGWEQLRQRIANAQMQLIAENRGAPPMGVAPEVQKKRLERRRMLSKPHINQMPESVRLAQLKQLESIMAEDEKWSIANRDMAAVRPYQKRLKELGRKRQKLARAARNE